MTADETRFSAPTRAMIDLAALRHNLALIRQAADRPVMAVVKANAYGHGVRGIAAALSAAGVERFAVATLREALALRAAGIAGRILVFGAPQVNELHAFEAHGLELTVSTPELLEAVLTSSLPLSVHLQVDTGMMRLGLMPGQAATALERLGQHDALTLTGAFTHFASADLGANAQTRNQLRLWRELRAQLPEGVETHASATGGVFTNPEVSAASDVVRAGIGLYGLYDPSGDVPEPGLRPVMRLTSRIARLQRVDPGTAVSYGGRWTTPARGTIITIASGYADGLPRALSSRGYVGHRGRLFPLAGTVCMDMCMAFAPESENKLQVGDEITLWGPGGPSVADVAGLCETIPYEIVCGVSERVDRIFLDGA